MKFKLALLILFFGCKSSSYLSKKDLIEDEKVEQCRKLWRYKTLENEVTIKILLQDPKGRYDTASWPNLFIGIDEKGDTIGITEHKVDSIFNTGDSLTFLPIKISETWISRPFFKVYKDSKKNDLYCSIDVIYEGRLKK